MDSLSDESNARAVVWESLSERQRDMMDNLYDGECFLLEDFVSQPVIHAEMEKYIAGYSLETIPQIVKSLGLVSCLSMHDITYFALSIRECIPLFEPHKAGSIKHMTDTQILNRLDVLVAYASRGGLISRAEDLLNGGTGFFVPYTRKGVNAVTSTGAPITDSVFTIAYGTLEKYTCYTPEDLNEGFASRGDGDVPTGMVLDVSGSQIQIPSRDILHMIDILEFITYQLRTRGPRCEILEVLKNNACSLNISN